MRVAYLGTSGFAADVLGTLAASRHQVGLVVSQPDRRSGRGRRASAPPVAERARELGLELVQPESVNGNEGAAPILAAGCEAGVICAFGQLIAEPLLGSLELLNVHPSALPRWRGAAPIERAILAGDERTATMIIRLVAALDAGPIALERQLAIEPRDDFATLSGRLAEASGALLLDALDLRERGELELRPQAEEGVTYAEKISAADRRLDPASRAEELDRRVRALSPHIGAYLALAGDERLGVREARPWDGEAPPQGTLADLEGSLVLGARGGGLELLEVQPPGKRAMAAADFLRGRAVPELG